MPGVSGVLTHTYTAEVDHDFRRWLTAIGKFTWGTQQYQGDDRFDRFYSLSGDLIYKLNRNIWLKGTLQRELAGFEPAGQQHGVDGGNAGGEVAALRDAQSVPIAGRASLWAMAPPNKNPGTRPGS